MMENIFELVKIIFWISKTLSRVGYKDYLWGLSSGTHKQPVHFLKPPFWLYTTKGQLISKGLFGVIVLTKKPTNFLMISALGSNKSSNQKNFIV